MELAAAAYIDSMRRLIPVGVGYVFSFEHERIRVQESSRTSPVTRTRPPRLARDFDHVPCDSEDRGQPAPSFCLQLACPLVHLYHDFALAALASSNEPTVDWQLTS